jgi:hypothetical protein
MNELIFMNVVAPIYNPSTQEVEAGGSPTPGQPVSKKKK